MIHDDSSGDILSGEEGWDSSSCEEEKQCNQNIDATPSTSRGLSTRRPVNVHRAEITTTIGQEANEELQDLNVEVYDQQTYEKGVFEQVDKAISSVDRDKQSNNKDDQVNERQSNLIQIIHAQSSKDIEDDNGACDPTERDEQVLQLTRRERINKTVKLEKVDPSYDNLVKTFPKIPKVSSTIDKSKNLDNSFQNQSSTDKSTQRPARSDRNLINNVKIEKLDDEELLSSDDSELSNYEPPLDENSSVDDEDVDYETDNELEPDQTDVVDDKVDSRRRKFQDDGDIKCYRTRMKKYNREFAKKRLANISEGIELKKLDELIQVDGDLQVDKELWDNLFEHQKTGVRWLWELHQLGTGGILGDEMGLGKTIQMIAFLAALRSSTLKHSHKNYESLGPTVLVCPATVMHQWLLEFRKWWPQFRVAILHSTGTFQGDRKNLVQVINKSNGILIVSYPGVVIYQDYLHNFDWHYVILDEGHKIRNPDAQVTLACKRFRTPHRLILSGSPVQNNLKELWSIFDFIYPGKLGTLPVFMEQFATPITQGGYANASEIQVQIAYKCACVLRDTIKPFLLRRTKAEVNCKLKLPDRSEQVLFCKLTEKQRKLYEAYLKSPTIRDIKAGFCQIFVGLIQLRKICNHPDLFDATECRNQMRQLQHASTRKNSEFFSEDETYGHIKKSGKMMVVDALLKLWKKQGHKVLLFTQSRQMIKIFKIYLDQHNYKYLTMDGTTSIAIRQTLIEEFNNNEEIFIFLLTTRVGGVGVNLIGANRIIIYDPDWNPSTDIQARERAWRIGQQRHVIIYRLLTAGTIEEKIYHRQVFKLYLTNRILKNAKQKRFFKTNDLHELFTLGDNDKNIETKALFDDDLQINPETIKRTKKKRKKLKRVSDKTKQNEYEVNPIMSEEKIKAMRERARRLSQMIALQYGSPSNTQQENQSVRIKIEPGCTPSPVENVVNVALKPEPDHVEATSSGTVELPTLKRLDNTANRDSRKHSKKESKKQHVEYLVKQDIYKPNDEGTLSSKRFKRDDYILERLFKSSNITGALKHDKIESDSTEDYLVVESEAEKVARDAIRVLRESRTLCLDSSSGVANWTGRNGHLATGPGSSFKSRGRIKFLTKLGSTSSSTAEKDGSLLASIRKRNHTNPMPLNRNSDDEDRARDYEGKALGTGAEAMADKIREFILFKSARSGESQTDEILDFFKETFKPDKTAIFKALLYKMCEFQRRGDKGFWVLKSDFRNI